MRLDDLAEILHRQEDVISRGQFAEAGGRPHDLERWMRRREIARLLPGVFITHTGRPTWLQQGWAAVLWGQPAALGLTSAVQAAGGRATRLPRARLQVEQGSASGPVVRDVLLPGGQVIELDGRAFHQGSRRRNEDLERDLDAAAVGLGTVRLGWGQVFDRPCSTAGKVSRLVALNGWEGRPTACGPRCVAPEVFVRARRSATMRS